MSLWQDLMAGVNAGQSSVSEHMHLQHAYWFVHSMIGIIGDAYTRQTMQMDRLIQCIFATLACQLGIML